MEDIKLLINNISVFINKIGDKDSMENLELINLAGDIIEKLQKHITTNSKLLKTNEILVKNIKDADETIFDLTNDIKKEKKDNTELSEKIQNLEDKVFKLNETLKDYENSNQDKNIEIASLNKIINTTSVKSPKQHVEKDSENIEKLKQDNKNYCIILAEIETRNKELENKCVQLEKNLFEVVNKENKFQKTVEVNNLSISDEICLINQKDELEMLRKDYKNLLIINRNLTLNEVNKDTKDKDTKDNTEISEMKRLCFKRCNLL